MGERDRIRPRSRGLATQSALALALAGAALAGCKGDRRVDPGSIAPVVAPPSAAVDRALPGELGEGSEEAFGLRIPRGMDVRARFPDAVFAVGTMKLEDVASYVRERVTPEHVETGPAKTVLTGARLKEGDPTTLRIEVSARGGEVSLVVRDETRPPAQEGLTEAERWKRLGLTPEGAPLDPTKLE